MTWLATYIEQLWAVSLELAPWLLLGCLVAGLLHVLIPEGAIRRQLGRPGFGGIFKAALAGVPMPLCSCGVIPAALGLRKEGASRGASVSFLVATPQTAVDSTFVSYSFMGAPFALFKLLSSFLTGLFAGTLAQRFGGPAETISAPVAQEQEPSSNGARYPSLGAKVRGVWMYGIEDLLYMIWGWVVLGVVVSAALTTFVPANFFADLPLASGFTGLLLALVISLPMYACSTASVPIAAGLVHAGLPAGAALVYLVAGPATNVATVGAIFRVFGGKVIAIYLGVIVASSLLFGYLFDFLVDMDAMRIHDHAHHDHAHGWAAVAAVCMALLFLRFAYRDIRMKWARWQMRNHAATNRMSLRVQGMTCNGCARKVQAALQAIPEVVRAEVQFDAKQAWVTGDKLDKAALLEAVRAAGYQAEGEA